MLPVSVELDGVVVAVALRVKVTGPHGSADAEVQWQVQHHDACGLRDLSSPVRRTVRDDEDVRTLRESAPDFPQHRGKHCLFIPCGNDHEKAPASQKFGHAPSS